MSGTTDTSETSVDEFFSSYLDSYNEKQPVEMSLGEYLKTCQGDKMTYATAAERLLHAIGEPDIIDTAAQKGPLNRIFQGKTIATYKAFSDFYGHEDVVEKIVAHLRGAAANTEFRKQVLYLLGPVGGGKSSLGDRLKELMESQPIYVLKSKVTGERSPIHESPLGLFSAPGMRKSVSEKFGIAERYLKSGMSPWALKRLKEAGGDINQAFIVEKVYPSRADKVAIAKVEPGDENNQDISILVGKLDINKLGEGVPQNDTDSYLYSGGLCAGNQGIMEFVEMFKAPLKVLNPLLEATQSGEFNGTENIGSIPFTGLIFAHSNESEWQKFSGDPKNEAILDRINVVRIPYTLRWEQEANIYRKILRESAFAEAPIAPQTIELLAKFSVLSRLSDAEGVDKYDPFIRLEVLNGDIPEGATDAVPTIGELYKEAPFTEGMKGASTRFAFKTLTAAFNENSNAGEIAADPVLLMTVLKRRIREEGRISDDEKEKFLGYIDKYLMKEYADFITDEITEAFTDISEGVCQNMFNRYINMASAWLNDEDYYDKGATGERLRKDAIHKKLQEIEKPCNVGNLKDFRNEVVMYVLAQERRTQEPVKWDSYQKMANVIRTNLNKTMKDILPVIKFDSTIDDEDTQKKRNTFFDNMHKKGYTDPMIRRAVSVYEKTI